MHVTSIAIYPIKATAEIDLQQAEVRSRGLAGDRRWMVVDEGGQFLHQRIRAKLALVKTTLADGDELLLDAPGMSQLHVDRPDGSQRLDVGVWSDTVGAADAGAEAAAWFSQFVGAPCHLVFMDAAATRPVAPEDGQAGDVVSFADAMPLLLASEASLADLNVRMENPLPMNRFRPNVVIDGDEPWIEESWKRLRIGDVDFEVTHPCLRCVVTTIDQQTGQKSGDSEPLRTLTSFRQTEDGVCFGVNLVPRSRSMVSVGDPVTVLSPAD